MSHTIFLRNYRPLIILLLIIQKSIIQTEELQLKTFCKLSIYHGLELASCTNRSLQSVPQNLESTTNVIILDHNKIRSLRNYEFSNYRQLQKIYIRYNTLWRIEADAFRGATNLKSLDFSNNKLPEIPSAAFRDFDDLKVLNMSNNPLFTITDYAFEKLRYLEYLGLRSCRLIHISDKAFSGLIHLKVIDLTRNNLRTITPNVFHPFEASLQILKIYNNPWKCNCKLRNIHEWLLTMNNRRLRRGFATRQLDWKFETGEPSCETPKTREGQRWADIGSEELSCAPVITATKMIGRKSGSRLALFCEAKGVPTPKIFWTALNQTINENNHDIITNETGSGNRITSTLKIEKINQNNTGYYACHAVNDGGLQEHKFEILLVKATTNDLSYSKSQLVATIIVSAVLFVFLIILTCCCTWLKCRNKGEYTTKYKPTPTEIVLGLNKDDKEQNGEVILSPGADSNERLLRDDRSAQFLPNSRSSLRHKSQYDSESVPSTQGMLEEYLLGQQDYYGQYGVPYSDRKSATFSAHHNLPNDAEQQRNEDSGVSINTENNEIDDRRHRDDVYNILPRRLLPKTPPTKEKLNTNFGTLAYPNNGPYSKYPPTNPYHSPSIQSPNSQHLGVSADKLNGSAYHKTLVAVSNQRQNETLCSNYNHLDNSQQGPQAHTTRTELHVGGNDHHPVTSQIDNTHVASSGRPSFPIYVGPELPPAVKNHTTKVLRAYSESPRMSRRLTVPKSRQREYQAESLLRPTKSVTTATCTLPRNVRLTQTSRETNIDADIHEDFNRFVKYEPQKTACTPNYNRIRGPMEFFINSSNAQPNQMQKSYYENDLPIEYPEPSRKDLYNTCATISDNYATDSEFLISLLKEEGGSDLNRNEKLIDNDNPESTV